MLVVAVKLDRTEFAELMTEEREEREELISLDTEPVEDNVDEDDVDDDRPVKEVAG